MRCKTLKRLPKSGKTKTTRGKLKMQRIRPSHLTKSWASKMVMRLLRLEKTKMKTMVTTIKSLSMRFAAKRS